MRVINNIHRSSAKTVTYGDAIRRASSGDDLFIVIDMFVGDGNVRVVDLASGKLVKIPEDEQVIVVEHAYVEVENSNGFI